jgi:hypothetical protein
MFGMLRPAKQDTDYRRVYARCCQHHQLNCGLLSVPFHSYEAVFLYTFALDAGAFSEQFLPEQSCCKLRTSRRLARCEDAKVGQFCSSVALLLASIKLEDDIQDDHFLSARLVRWLLKRRFDKVNRYFLGIDPAFGLKTKQLIEAHHSLEESGLNVPLFEYVKPTAEAFSYVFGLMAKLPGLETCSETLSLVGHHVGAAIIAADCAMDWMSDRLKGRYNPLVDEAARSRALLLALDHLEQAAEACQRQFGENSRSVKLLFAVREALEHRFIRASENCVRSVESGAVFAAAAVMPILAQSHSTTSSSPSGGAATGSGNECWGCLACLCISACAGGGTRKTVVVRDGCGNEEVYEKKGC